MMREIGEVIGIENDFAKIQIKRSEACEKCGACDMGQSKMMETMAKNAVSAKIGDQVELEAESVNILKASFILYGIPLIVFMVGTFLGYFIANFMGLYAWNNLIGFIAGVIFMLISYASIKRNESKFNQDDSYQLSIHRIIKN